MTYRQAEALGGNVRRGETGAVSVYYSSFKKHEAHAETGQDVIRSIRFLRHYIVFNADQINGLPAYFYAAAPETPAAPSDHQAEIDAFFTAIPADRSEEHTSELQSLMRISYAVFCLKKKTHKNTKQHSNTTDIKTKDT